jgi:hypothetical protein
MLQLHQLPTTDRREEAGKTAEIKSIKATSVSGARHIWVIQIAMHN